MSQICKMIIGIMVQNLYPSFIYDYYYYLVCSIPNKEDYKYEIIIDILI